VVIVSTRSTSATGRHVRRLLAIAAGAALLAAPVPAVASAQHGVAPAAYTGQAGTQQQPFCPPLPVIGRVCIPVL
jgi:hypothetical protein